MSVSAGAAPAEQTRQSPSEEHHFARHARSLQLVQAHDENSTASAAESFSGMDSRPAPHDMGHPRAPFAGVPTNLGRKRRRRARCDIQPEGETPTTRRQHLILTLTFECRV